MTTTNRRKWLKLMGLGIAGMSVSPLTLWAAPGIKQQSSHTPDADNPIRLSSNENPYGPSPLARAAMTGSIADSNRYNWATASMLVSAIAEKNSVDSGMILLGAGSTEILDLTAGMFSGTTGSFLVAEPSYTGWTASLEQAGLKKKAVPLSPDKRYDLAAMSAAIEPGTQLVYICNPNNPTGTLCDREMLLSFIREASRKTFVIVDEAYLDFTKEISVSTLCADNKNLLVIKTFSKIYGLAGTRTGYAIAHEETIGKLSRFLSWPNGAVSVVSRSGALASLKDHDFIQQCYTRNEAVRKFTMDQLALLHIPCIPSSTNFIYFSLAEYRKDFFALLKDHNIQGTKIYEEDGQWTRITIGTLQEMHQFIAAIR